MQLYEICPEAEGFGIKNTEINKITDNTKSFEKGDIFVCIEGENFDGHSAAKDFETDAAAIIVTHDIGLKKQVIVENTRSFLSVLASRFYGEPTKKLKLIGVTGTNGKTTTASIIKYLIEESGEKCGFIGTTGYDTCGSFYEAHLTTPLPLDLYKYFAEMVENGANYAVMEVSSQALAQYRIANECFDCAVFTNLTKDHLDYHKSINEYFKAKRGLFDMAKTAVVCADDKYGEKLIKYLSENEKIKIKTYSTHDIADYYALNIKTRRGGISYWLSSLSDEKSFPVTLKMPGAFNVANSVAAVAVLSELGFYINDSVKKLHEYKGVRGRSEVIYDGDITVICDYAHTEDALIKFLSTVHEFAEKRVICIFGAAGERDAGKRPAMGEAVAKYCDYAVITSDNPRFENEDDIINEVEKGMINMDTPYVKERVREKAIEIGLLEAKPGDIVVLCGKGHETYQVIGDDYIDFDERIIVKNILNKLEGK